MYRIWIESIFGFTLRENKVSFQPNLPANWNLCELTYRHRTSLYRFILKRDDFGEASPTTLVFSEGSASPSIELTDDGQTREFVLSLRPANLSSLPPNLTGAMIS
jgi:cellobiose phosphorylase